MVEIINTLTIVLSTFGVGYIIGFALRKAMSVLLTISGLYVLSLMGLAKAGVIVINWTALSSLIEKLIGSSLSSGVSSIISLTSLSMPFLAGLFTGFVFCKTTIRKRKYWVRC